MVNPNRRSFFVADWEYQVPNAIDSCCSLSALSGSGGDDAVSVFPDLVPTITSYA